MEKSGELKLKKAINLSFQFLCFFFKLFEVKVHNNDVIKTANFFLDFQNQEKLFLIREIFILILYYQQCLFSVFVSVIDPGVGTNRKSIVVKTKDNHYVVTPDNGTITFIDKEIGIDEVREVDETKHRLKGSEYSSTFYGRDVYVYTGAKLASGKISFEDVGRKLDISTLKRLNVKKADFKDGVLYGNIPVLDVNYGNVWTNIDRNIANKLNLKKGKTYNVIISNEKKKIAINNVVYSDTFGNVKTRDPVLYFNSLDYLAIALNSGNFAKQYKVGYGAKWKIKIKESN